MSYKNELDIWISEMESKVSSLQITNQKRESRVKRKIASLILFAEKVASPQGKLRLRRKLASILSTKSTDLTLEKVEKEVDAIYGDQSKNETYYFNRKNRNASVKVPHWSALTLEQAEKVMDKTYGDQSKNETFYPGRKNASSHMTLEEVEREMDELYGDQSKNDTWYPSRNSFRRQAASEQPGATVEGSSWYDMSLEDVEKEMDGLYGDQSKNQTFYPGRKSASTHVADRPLHEIEKEHDDFWGDQSKNETWYPSRNSEDVREDVGEVDWLDFGDGDGLEDDPYVEAYDISPDQYRLKDTDWEESRNDRVAEPGVGVPSPMEGVTDTGYDPKYHDVEPSLNGPRDFPEYKESMQPANEPGYFTQGEFDTWDQRVDMKAPRVEQYEGGHGDLGGSPAPHQAPHVIEDRDEARGNLNSLRGSLIHLGHTNPELREHLRSVLDSLK